MKHPELGKLTCLIPLYRSHRFLSVIYSNIDAHLASGARVLVSDQHGYDDAAALIRERYRGAAGLRVFESKEEGDWVDNINFLMRHTRTPFGRILPHDDDASAESSRLLVRKLIETPQAVLATGIVRAIDLEGRPIPEKDKLNADELRPHTDWTFEDGMSFFWDHRFNGAFKGVWRNEVICRHDLYIKKTPSLVHSERLWLSALAMVGPFLLEPAAELLKRYYHTSTHADWRYLPSTYMESGEVLYAYFRELHSNPELLRRGRFIIFHNGIRKARFAESRLARPAYSGVAP